MKLGKLLFFFLLLGNFHLLLAENYNYAGFAVTQKGGKKVYSDNHTEIWKNGKHIASKIVYKDANGKAFAEKEINFSKNPNLPDFKLEDSRDGYMEGAMLLPNNKIKLFYRENQNSKAEERVMSIPKNSAIDGGFDFYLKNHWDDLLAGKSICFNFFAPSKLNYYKFQIRMTKKGKYNGKD
ncbi:MAG: hypothetical protein KDK36_03235, partial [Leptospiraceae bacterium]|nr:hypothetical protein [Leptospiraceae bacterium]